MVIVGITDDMTISQLDVAARIVGDVWVVGYEDDGSSLGIELLEEYENLETGSGIEVTRSLIGENHGRVVHQSSGDGHTLHLSTRHLVTLVIESLAQAHSLQGFDGTLLALLGSNGRIVHQWQLHILHTGSLWQKVVVLEDETNLAVAEDGTVVAAHLSYADTIQIVFTTGWRVETSQLIQ